MFSSAMRLLIAALAFAAVSAQDNGCQTAFAGGDVAGSTSFCDDTDPAAPSSWGWVVGPLPSGTSTYPIHEAAGNCRTSNGDQVGTMTVTYTGGCVSVVLSTEGESRGGYPHIMEVAHVYIGTERYPTGISNPRAAGGYPYNSGEISTNSVTVDEVCGFSDTDGVYVIAHMETCNTEVDEPRVDPPPGDGGAGDDPHFKNWAGEWFDYMGQCDLVLIHAPAFAQGLGLDVHIRTVTRYDYSYISNAVLKIADETLEVASYGEYLLNGVAGVDMPAMIAGYPISYDKVDAHTTVFSVEIGNNEHIRFKTFKDFVTVKFEGATERNFEDSVGLMGHFNTRHMLSRSGEEMSTEDVNALAQEWQVNPNTDGQLFQVADRAPQYPAKCMGAPVAEPKTNLRLSASVN